MSFSQLYFRLRGMADEEIAPGVVQTTESLPPEPSLFERYPALKWCWTVCSWVITVFAALFILWVVYIVVGGLVLGESALLNGRPYFAVPFTFILMAVIAILEGFAFSITVLKL